MAYWGYLGICARVIGVIFPTSTSWNFLGNHDDLGLGLFGDLAWIIWGYLGIWHLAWVI